MLDGMTVMERQNTSRVFLIAQPTIKKDGSLPDLTPLAEYGDVKVVVEAGEYPAYKPGETWRRVADKLRDFDAENDYLVWAGGDTLSACMVGVALASLGHRCFRWLRFERNLKPGGNRDQMSGRYTPVEVQLL